MWNVFDERVIVTDVIVHSFIDSIACACDRYAKYASDNVSRKSGRAPVAPRKENGQNGLTDLDAL